ncbi:hypothetical protein [Aerococcus kribbianus]|uniref:Uncharacterized protein n=1 Tax=Aerococcus kribbianus TaxID=2999064 RepID=A0A9X3FT01_9LACT|nr:MULTISPECIES: hypothetical protein [unclassified Aerococcus]MCZ0717828.1 hypothetical protein [Aerococcus sp. YH-aer221]MCZ0726115.1 hypothetical protein [Aerococcus sp. YH-aer222]
MVTNLNGFTINDVLSTDYDLIVDILCKNDESQQEEVVDLANFIQTI